MKNKRKKIKWRRLDNSAKIFPIIATKKFSTVFRISVLLNKKVQKDILEQAVNMACSTYEEFKVKLRRGFFWYYLEVNAKPIKIEEEKNYPCKPLNKKKNNNYLFQITYFNNKINLEIFHSLTDGNTAIEFFKEIVYKYIDIKNGFDNTNIKKNVNNTEDSYIKNYNKKKAIRGKSKRAYILRGEKFPLYAIGVIHGIINLQQLKNVSKKYNCTVTQYITAVLAYSIYKENVEDKESKKPIKICIPVNLKKYFASSTITNFFSYITIEVVPKEIENLNSVINITKKEFDKKLNQENLEKTMDSNVKIGKNTFIRMLPLFLKKISTQLSYIEIRKYTTTTISNLGQVNIDKKYKPFIKNVLFLLAPESVEKTKCSVCTYENNLVVTFTSILKETKIQKEFFDILHEESINFEIQTNGVYDDLSENI